MAEAATTYEEELASGAESQKSVLDKQIAEEKAAREAGIARLEQARKAREPEWDRFKQKQAEVEAVGPPPKLEKPPAAPNTQEMLKPTSLQQTFGMASIFALLSVGIAKGSAIYGLKALGGFMEGAHAGNVEQAGAALKDFNSNMQRVHASNESSLQEYNAIFNNKKYTLEMQEHAFKLKALEFNDELALQEYAQKGMTGTHALLRERAKVDFTFAKEMQRYTEWEAKIAYQKQKMAQAASGGMGGLDLSTLPPPQPGQKNEELLKRLDPATAELVKRMANYDLPSSGFGGLDVKTRSKLTQLATLYDPNFSASDYGVRAGTKTEYSPKGGTGQNIVAINTMTHHINDFADAYGKLNNSQVQRWNSTRNKLATEFGDPGLQRVQVSGLAAAGELAKVIKGGRAAPTDQEMAAWEKVFSTSMSKEQMNAVVWQALQTAGGRLTVLEDAFKQQMGGREVNALYPETREIIMSRKPKGAPVAKWLSRGASDLSDLEKKAELSQAEKDKIRGDIRSRVAGATSKDKDGRPIHKDPDTGRWAYD